MILEKNVSQFPAIVLHKIKCEFKECETNSMVTLSADSPQTHEILHHFFAKVVINAINLFFSEQGCKVIWKFLWTCTISAKWLFNDYASPTPVNRKSNKAHSNTQTSNKTATKSSQMIINSLFSHASIPYVHSDRLKNSWGQCQVKQSVSRSVAALFLW